MGVKLGSYVRNRHN